MNSHFITVPSKQYLGHYTKWFPAPTSPPVHATCVHHLHALWPPPAHICNTLFLSRGLRTLHFHLTVTSDSDIWHLGTSIWQYVASDTFPLFCSLAVTGFIGKTPVGKTYDATIPESPLPDIYLKPPNLRFSMCWRWLGRGSPFVRMSAIFFIDFMYINCTIPFYCRSRAGLRYMSKCFIRAVIPSVLHAWLHLGYLHK